MKNILNNIQQLIIVIARGSMFPERRGNLSQIDSPDESGSQ
jgi:hypothetical protein